MEKREEKIELYALAMLVAGIFAGKYATVPSTKTVKEAKEAAKALIDTNV